MPLTDPKPCSGTRRSPVQRTPVERLFKPDARLTPARRNESRLFFGEPPCLTNRSLKHIGPCMLSHVDIVLLHHDKSWRRGPTPKLSHRKLCRGSDTRLFLMFDWPQSPGVWGKLAILRFCPYCRFQLHDFPAFQKVDAMPLAVARYHTELVEEPQQNEIRGGLSQ